MKYTKEQRELIIEEAKDKVVYSLEYDELEEYWVMTFTDESDMSFRFMSELT